MQDMYIQIGQAREHDFTEPLGLLGDCHRRIERFLEVLRKVADQGGELGPQERHALGVSLRYFREAAPHHTHDEEESLFPRMRVSQDPRAAEALRRLEELEGDHDRAEALHADTDALFEQWLADGRLTAGATTRLRNLLAELSELYRRHIAVEDGEVFPLAGQVLDAEALVDVGREMAARRGL